jgi:hypothetical protein
VLEHYTDGTWHENLAGELREFLHDFSHTTKMVSGFGKQPSEKWFMFQAQSASFLDAKRFAMRDGAKQLELTTNSQNMRAEIYMYLNPDILRTNHTRCFYGTYEEIASVLRILVEEGEDNLPAYDMVHW